MTWNGTNEVGLAVANGIYYYRLNSDLGIETKKMLFLKELAWKTRMGKKQIN